jgi:carbon monoxide dehydrogenase subunit G
MRFAAKEDIGAPLAAVYAALTDFESFERLVLAKGAEVARKGGPGVGTTWDLGFRLRGRKRQVTVRLVAAEPPAGLRFAGNSSNLDMVLSVSLVALAQQRTRMNVDFEVTPRTLAARILLQSARLGKARLTRKFQKRVHQAAGLVAARAAAAQA